jgi:hypothetical protein
MNVKSKDDTDADQARQPKKKYMWLGYGEDSNLTGVAPGPCWTGAWRGHRGSLTPFLKCLE